MDYVMRELEPNLVWSYFDRLTTIPRPSGDEERAVEWLIGVAESRGLAWRRDATGNLLISAPATAGYEDRATITLQAHLDMVCEKRGDVVHNFATDPISTYIDDGWVKARGTTLGADCGIGVAAALAALTDPTLEHAALDALFTLDEERGLTGAFGLGEGMIRGRYLLNFDSEDEGEIFIGCAGGVDTVATFDIVRAVALSSTLLRVDIGGLAGGHSGDDIDKGRDNAIKLLATLISKGGGRLVTIAGGNLRNAIPREASAEILVESLAQYEMLREGFATEEGATLELHDLGVQRINPLAEELQHRLISTLVALPNGVVALSAEFEGVVESSSNLASITTHSATIEVVTSQRSLLTSLRDEVRDMVAASFTSGGGAVTHSDGYPGWQPRSDSPLLRRALGCYRSLFGVDAKVRIIHAGLECGLFLESYPDLDMISFGPTMRGVHSPDERLEIASVERFWQLLTAILRSA